MRFMLPLLFGGPVPQHRATILALVGVGVASLGCSGLLGTNPCDALLTRDDLAPLAGSIVFAPTEGRGDDAFCAAGFLPENEFQTWAEVEAGVPGRVHDQVEETKAWKDRRELSGGTWTAVLYEADAAAAPGDDLPIEAILDGTQPALEGSVDRWLSGLPPQQHVWVVRGPTRVARFTLDRDLVAGAALDELVRTTAARIP